jgi:hypothetical protein
MSTTARRSKPADADRARVAKFVLRSPEEVYEIAMKHSRMIKAAAEAGSSQGDMRQTETAHTQKQK